MKQRLEEIVELRTATEHASVQRKVAFAALATFATYVLIVVGQVRHRHLILDTPILLPLVDAEVSLASFFVFAPVILLALHVQAIAREQGLDRRLRLLERKISSIRDRRVRQMQYAIAPDEVRRGNAGWWSALVSTPTLSKLALFIAPPVLLLFLQASYLPVHSVYITWLHRGVLLSDALAVGIAVASVEHLRVRRSFVVAIATLAMTPLVAASLFVATIPGESIEEFLLTRFPTKWIAMVPKQREFSMDGLPLRARQRPILLLTLTLLESGSSPIGLSRNLVLRDESFVIAEPTGEQVEKLGEDLAWRRHGKAATFDGRDLRYADLTRADLRGVRLRAVNLREAILREADLEFVNADGIPLIPGHPCAGESVSERYDQIAPSCATNLAFADLQKANLAQSSFRDAYFVGANLRAASLQRIDAGNAHFAAADLTEAKADGARLIGANLDGAFASESSFRGACLSFVRGRAVDLSAANLSGSDLEYANLEGARLDRALLRGTGLEKAKLTAVRARFADFTGAVLVSSVLNVADLRDLQSSPRSEHEVAADVGQPCADSKGSVTTDTASGPAEWQPFPDWALNGATYALFDEVELAEPSPGGPRRRTINRTSSSKREHESAVRDELLRIYNCRAPIGVGILKQMRYERKLARWDREAAERVGFEGAHLSDEDFLPSYVDYVENALLDESTCPTAADGANPAEVVRRHADYLR